MFDSNTSLSRSKALADIIDAAAEPWGGTNGVMIHPKKGESYIPPLTAEDVDAMERSVKLAFQRLREAVQKQSDALLETGPASVSVAA